MRRPGIADSPTTDVSVVERAPPQWYPVTEPSCLRLASARVSTYIHTHTHTDGQNRRINRAVISYLFSVFSLVTISPCQTDTERVHLANSGIHSSFPVPPRYHQGQPVPASSRTTSSFSLLTPALNTPVSTLSSAPSSAVEGC